MLAMLAHASSLKLAKHEQSVRLALVANSLPEKQGFGAVPRDPEYYRAKWRQIANDFYAKHPVERPGTDEPAQEVVTASLSDEANSAARFASAEGVVSPVSHVKATDAAIPPEKAAHPPEKDEPKINESALDSESVAKAAVVTRYQKLGSSAIVASLAAGLLACWFFCAIWPPPSLSANAGQRKTIAFSDTLRLELPSEWVYVRPPLKQRLRTAVVVTSYIVPWFAIGTIVR
jgi:hypothetical protein